MIEPETGGDGGRYSIAGAIRDGPIVLVTRGDRAVETRRRDGAAWVSEPARHHHPARELMRLAGSTDGWVAWFDERLEPFLSDVTTWPTLATHPLEVLHAGAVDRPGSAIDSLAFVEFASLYFFAPPGVRRSATWFVSAAAGVARAPVLRAVSVSPVYRSPAAALIDFGGRAVRSGVCAYAEPGLLTRDVPPGIAAQLRVSLTASDVALLVRRLHDRRWLGFWLLAKLLFDRSLPALAALRAAGAEPAPATDAAPIDRLGPSLGSVPEGTTVDAIVPTLYRPQCVEDLLEDLAAQTLLPRSVIIVEQRPDSTPTELSRAIARPWPFAVSHHCVDWVGACRARNVGLAQATGDWILMLDDDVHLTRRFVEYSVRVATTYRAEAVTALVESPGRPGGDVLCGLPHFTSVFPGGASLVAGEAVRRAGPFDLALEGGWGEDFEFGARLRRTGSTVLRAPREPVMHYHAPAGGFRAPLEHPWDDHAVQPRPSPTVLLSRRGLLKPAQQGYRLFYSLKRLSSAPRSRVIRELDATWRQWRCAAQWADRLAGK